VRFGGTGDWSAEIFNTDQGSQWEERMDINAWSEYTPTDSRLLSLYSKGKSLQWNAEDDLDWECVDPSTPLHASAFPLLAIPVLQQLSSSTRETLVARFTQSSLSQILHGEQGALMVASHLVHMSPDFEAKLYAATQTMDEARHVEVFSRYLTRCGGITPVNPSLRRFIEGVLTANTWPKMLIGMQIVIEGSALYSFHSFREKTRDPILLQIFEGVIRDEARHVGFGTRYLRSWIEQLRAEDLEAISDFAYETVMEFANVRRDGFRQSEAILNDCGISLDDVLRSAAASRAPGQMTPPDVTRDGVMQAILPMLIRLGALTPRVQAKFHEARLAPDMTSAILDQLDFGALDRRPANDSPD
jgi:ribosomal protein S18 acetylase RimI-like enzyme